jgi:hypothetical protein
MMSLSSGDSIAGVKMDCVLFLAELERLELER